MVSTLLNVAFAVPALWPLAQDRLVNAAFFDEMGWPSGYDPEVALAAVGIVVVCAWDVVEGWLNAHRAAGRTRTATAC
jgi:hypothetical protein